MSLDLIEQNEAVTLFLVFVTKKIVNVYEIILLKYDFNNIFIKCYIARRFWIKINKKNSDASFGLLKNLIFVWKLRLFPNRFKPKHDKKSILYKK